MSLLRSSIHPNQNKFLFFIWSYFNLGHAWGKVFTFPFEFQLVRPDRAGFINCGSGSDPTFTIFSFLPSKVATQLTYYDNDKKKPYYLFWLQWCGCSTLSCWNTQPKTYRFMNIDVRSANPDYAINF